MGGINTSPKPSMPRRKPNKFAEIQKINGRQPKLPKGSSGNAVAKLSELIANLAKQNPDHDWASEAQEWPRCFRAAVKTRGISLSQHHELGRQREDEKDPRHQPQNAS